MLICSSILQVSVSNMNSNNVRCPNYAKRQRGYLYLIYYYKTYKERKEPEKCLYYSGLFQPANI